MNHNQGILISRFTDKLNSCTYKFRGTLSLLGESSFQSTPRQSGGTQRVYFSDPSGVDASRMGSVGGQRADTLWAE